ncbi:MAG: hypothetical protein WCE21_01825, partial [Candidatus Babeliales bacterium]
NCDNNSCRYSVLLHGALLTVFIVIQTNYIRFFTCCTLYSRVTYSLDRVLQARLVPMHMALFYRLLYLETSVVNDLGSYQFSFL